MAPSKRTGSAKASRHTKKYWKKGANVEEIEDSIYSKAREQETGGIVSDLKNDELFMIDRVEKEDIVVQTRKQRAALEKISKRIEVPLTALPKPKKPTAKQARLKRGATSQKKTNKAFVKTKNNKFDIWNTDMTPKVSNLDNSEAAEHFLRTVKKKLPKTPAKAITSILPAVQISVGGSSYNPEAGEYTSYVKKIATEEDKVIAKEAKIQRGIVPQWETSVSESEKLLEMQEGLKIHPKYAEDGDLEQAMEVSEDAKSKIVLCERMTKEDKKKKDRSAEIALEEKKRLNAKAKEVDSHNVYRVKQITKELQKEEEEQKTRSQVRKVKKITDKLTTRQTLGSGKFVDAEDPFLLPEELTGSLRQLRPQGHVLEDRMKSLQRRNMLPIGGNKSKTLKKSLKRKIVEKRSVKDVTKGSRVI